MELYALLKKEYEIEVDDPLKQPIPLSSEHLPAAPTSGEEVILVALREMENVNLIQKDHVLRFSEAGITVIYGKNGSGKSGYARVIKRACRARDQSEQIYPNAYDATLIKKVPTAIFEIKIAGATDRVAWSRDGKPPDLLSSISVFDSKCARSYLTAEQDVAYIPYGLDVVENLANQVLPKITELLEAEINAIDIRKHSVEHLIGETEVGIAIKNLSATSDETVLMSLGTLAEYDINRIANLKLTLNERNPQAKAEEVKISAMRLKTYAEKLIKPLNWISNEAVGKLRKLHLEKLTAESAEATAADALQAGEELLPGTGNQVWKALFDAATRYSMEATNSKEFFPPSTESAVCPLCQEGLSESGLLRLKRFNDYIKNDIAKTADAARKKVDIARGKIEAADLRIIADDALCCELDTLDCSTLKEVAEYQTSIDLRRASMLDCLKTSKWEDIPELSTSPKMRVRGLAAQQLKTFRTFARASNEDARKNLDTELKELIARQNLAKSIKTVIELLARMKRRAALERCRGSLKTRTISEKSKEFATAAVTDELRKALDKEFDALGIGHIKTKLKERSVRGKMHHQLLLDLPTTNKIEEILSEGEQRAIALGSFFAELSLSSHSCGVVFDDPVSSLDHWRRQNVAHRLVNEAKRRQVIVFTHDTSFLGQLCDEIEREIIPNSMLFLEWKNNAPGSVNDGLPWDDQGYKARINAIEQAQSKLAKSWPTYPGEKEIGEIRHQYDRLRATLERVIQDVVFNGVVKRYRDWIRVDSLEEVIGFDRAEYEAIAKLHKRSCNFITAHDPSSAKAATVPNAIDLGADIAALNEIIKTIQNRRKNIKSAL